MFPPPDTDRATDLLNRLLDKGYADTTSTVARAILNTSTGGAMGQRLREFEAEAKRLKDAGLPLTTDNPIYAAMMSQFQTTLNQQAGMVDGVASAVQENGVEAGLDASRQMTLMAAGLPDNSAVNVLWKRPDPEVINRVVGYTSSGAWANELGDLPLDILNTVNNAIIRGIVEGRNPLSIARDVRDMTGNMPLWKANNILRTLQMESYRAATTASYVENSDILQPYAIRIAALDMRTCLFCVSEHGKQIPINESVISHHQCRCTTIAMVTGRTYNIKTGESWYNGLTAAQQLQLAGAANYNALKAGAVTLSDFRHAYTDPVFGDMMSAGSLVGILGDAASQYYQRNQ